MKTIIKLTAAAAVISQLVAPQAFAGDTLGQQRLADRNAEYFKQQGTSVASNWTAPATASDAASPAQRMGVRNAEYFAGKGSSSESSKRGDAQQPHPRKH